MLALDVSRVTIRAADRSRPECGTEHDPAFVAAGDGLVELSFELTVFDAGGEAHAARIAQAELGKHSLDVLLAVASVEERDASGTTAERTDEDDGHSGEDDRSRSSRRCSRPEQDRGRTGSESVNRGHAVPRRRPR